MAAASTRRERKSVVIFIRLGGITGACIVKTRISKKMPYNIYNIPVTARREGANFELYTAEFGDRVLFFTNFVSRCVY
ncbi:MAG: hypothetical protein AVDCRST_MAG56-5428 [uncultured Cytophagales bacterium]|uniref:Uncharacterized protein n=1 Tax=uncultured Cytophagales bacterium TaxID=158755 RepID=A0A6J4KCC8_9SPHI|nr:MAG: hypothetical protein AVDCRST_MAG56-5428 [uncultured Cytophagales bacterium]